MAIVYSIQARSVRRTVWLLPLLGLSNSHFTHLVQHRFTHSTPHYITGICQTMTLQRTTLAWIKGLGGPATVCGSKVRKGTAEGTTNLRSLHLKIIFLAFQERWEGDMPSNVAIHVSPLLLHVSLIYYFGACDSSYQYSWAPFFNLRKVYSTFFFIFTHLLSLISFILGSCPVQPVIFFLATEQLIWIMAGFKYLTQGLQLLWLLGMRRVCCTSFLT